MNFEQRIDRLTERHEVMAQSMELWIASVREAHGRHERILEQNSLDMGRVDAKIDRLSDKIDTLASIALSHERRISNLEGRQL